MENNEQCGIEKRRGIDTTQHIWGSNKLLQHRRKNEGGQRPPKWNVTAMESTAKTESIILAKVWKQTDFEGGVIYLMYFLLSARLWSTCTTSGDFLTPLSCVFV